MVAAEPNPKHPLLECVCVCVDKKLRVRGGRKRNMNVESKRRSFKESRSIKSR